MARSRIGPREPVERPADLHASIPFPPMEAELVRELPEGTTGSTSRSGTASAGCSRTDPASFASGRGTPGRCCATSPSCGRSRSFCRPSRRSTARSSSSATASSTSTRCRRGCIPPRAASTGCRPRFPRASSRSTCSSGRASRSGTGRSRSAVRASSGARSASSSPPPRAIATRRSAGSTASRRRARRSDREAPRPPVPPRLARGRREGEAGEDGGLRRRRRALEVEARPHRDAPARPLPRRRGGRLRRLGGGRARRHDEIADRVLPLLENAPERRFSEPNRWGGGELEESPVRPEPSSRCATTRCSGTAFATGRSSSASAPTRMPSSARGTRYGRRLRATDSIARCSGSQAARSDSARRPVTLVPVGLTPSGPSRWARSPIWPRT